jgi:hypothetical protein
MEAAMTDASRTKVESMQNITRGRAPAAQCEPKRPLATIRLHVCFVLSFLILAVGRPATAQDLPRRPISFESNAGQFGSDVKFVSRSRSQNIVLKATELILSAPGSGSVVKMRLIGSNAQPSITGRSPMAKTSHYIFGNDPKKWRSNVAHFGEIHYRAVYPGIDLVWRGTPEGLRYDFIVGPGADPARIRLAFHGIDHLKIDDDGDLLLRADGQELRQRHPVLYQEHKGVRESVKGRFALVGSDSVRFVVGEYDRTLPLVIDPTLVLGYSTYLGGLGTDVGNGIALDAEGNAYVVGRTESDDFPLAASMQSTRHGGRDMFVTKLNSEGTGLVYSTYIGGIGDENPLEVVVDASGNAYIAGVTSSLDFPIVNAPQPVYGGGAMDGFALKLSADGSALLYATYLGASGIDQARGIAIDSTGSAYVTGNTQFDGFPLKNPIQPVSGGLSDAFVAKLTPSGDEFVYSTLVGGIALESGRGIRVDAEGNAFVVGETRSSNFPVTPGAFQTTFGGGLNDLFVIKVNAAGTALTFATYLGGSGADQGQASISGSATVHGRIIAIDSSGNAYVTGDTASLDFPTKNAIQPEFGGGPQDAFVAKLTSDGSDLVYATYFGGSGFDTARTINVDATGQAVFAGATSSLDLPTVDAYQTEYGGGDFDGFVTRLAVNGDALIYSTYLGGIGTDVVWDTTLGPKSRQVHLTGHTSSPDFPLNGAVQSSIAGGLDAFVVKLVITGPPSR